MMSAVQRDKWDRRIKDYGFAVVACMAMAGAFVALGGWFSSKIATPLVESHREFLASQVEIGRQQAETLKEVRQIVQTVSDTEQKQTTILEDVRECAKATAVVTSAVGAVHERQTQLLETIQQQTKPAPKGG